MNVTAARDALFSIVVDFGRLWSVQGFGPLLAWRIAEPPFPDMTRAPAPIRKQASRSAPTRYLLWTAMKGGLLGGRLGVSPKSESKEARCSCCTLVWI
jgi:hypothetical protein